MQGHSDMIRSVTVDPETGAILSASDDCTIMHWYVQSDIYILRKTERAEEGEREIGMKKERRGKADSDRSVLTLLFSLFRDSKVCF